MKNPASKHSPSHVSRKAQAQSRPGLAAAMKQGSTKRNGDASMVGDTRLLMRNGGKTPRVKPTGKKLAGIMCQ